MATLLEVGTELKRLRAVLPPPRGVSPDAALDGYATALAPFPMAIVSEAIDRYLAAEFPDVSLKFYPRAPELAHLCRLVQHRHAEEAERIRRAEDRARERHEMDEAEKLAHKTPEQLARAAAIYQGFLDSRVDVRASERAARLARERAETRARYGMTDEVLAGIKDRPLPKGMASVAAAAAAALPAPPEQQPGMEDL